MSKQLSLRDAVAYILGRTKCLHPFRISRILVLANWLLEEKGLKPVEFSVEGFKAGFYIPELSVLIDRDKCFKRNEEAKCIEYTCPPPKMSREYIEAIENAISKVVGLDDTEVNRLVIHDPRYSELLRLGGFRN